MKKLTCDKCKNESKVAKTYQISNEMLTDCDASRQSPFGGSGSLWTSSSYPWYPVALTVELCDDCYRVAANAYAELKQSLRT